MLGFGRMKCVLLRNSVALFNLIVLNMELCDAQKKYRLRKIE